MDQSRSPNGPGKLKPLVTLFLIGFVCHVCRSQDDTNLFEFGYGGFTNGGVLLGPILLPPIIQIDEGGFAIIYREGHAVCGQVTARDLARFKTHLKQSAVLRKTQILRFKVSPRVPSHHGGIMYVRHLDGSDEIIVASFQFPVRGGLHDIIEYARTLRLYAERPYTPAWIDVETDRYIWGKEVDWPFLDRPVATLPDRITDPEINRFLLSHLQNQESLWLEVCVKESTESHCIRINQIQGWASPERIAILLGALAAEYENEE